MCDHTDLADITIDRRSSHAAASVCVRFGTQLLPLSYPSAAPVGVVRSCLSHTMSDATTERFEYDISPPEPQASVDNANTSDTYHNDTNNNHSREEHQSHREGERSKDHSNVNQQSQADISTRYLFSPQYGIVVLSFPF